MNLQTTLTHRVSVTRVFVEEHRNFPVEAALTALTVTVVRGCGRGRGRGQGSAKYAQSVSRLALFDGLPVAFGNL